MLLAVDVQRGVSSPALSRRRNSRVRSSWFHTRRKTSRKWKVNFRRSVMASLLSWTRNSSHCLAPKSKTFYYKMKGDYCRYLAEFATGETKSKADEDACVACAEATKIAEKDLVVNHPVRLAMALSSSVFQSEVLQNPDDVAGGVHVGKNDLGRRDRSPWSRLSRRPRRFHSCSVLQRWVMALLCKSSMSHSWMLSRKSLKLRRSRRAMTPRIKFNRVLWSRSSKFLLFHSLRISLRYLSLGRKIKRNTLWTHMSSTLSTQSKQRCPTSSKIHSKKPIINEKINQVTKHVEIPQLQTVEKTAETPQTQMIQGTQASESLDTAPLHQVHPTDVVKPNDPDANWWVCFQWIGRTELCDRRDVGEQTSIQSHSEQRRLWWPCLAVQALHWMRSKEAPRVWYSTCWRCGSARLKNASFEWSSIPGFFKNGQGSKWRAVPCVFERYVMEWSFWQDRLR